MKWQFNVQEGSKKHTFSAEIILTTHQIEEILVTGLGESFILQNNRPLLVAIELKQAINWKLIKGKSKNENLLELIKKQLESKLPAPGVNTTVQPTQKKATV